MEQNNGLTVDMIIAKFVPILGAILFVTGLGYLIYTSVWESMDQAMRLGVGFFVSIVIIGSAFSFSDKLRYFADVIMGGGILLLYGTLIYGSRTTDIAIALIPEMVTLITAFFFTLAVGYFSSLRKSKVILALAILGAYLTPFLIGQNDIWASNISFNSYLVYFAAVNIVLFFMGREIAVHDLIPLNLGGLLFGTYAIQHLIYTGEIQEISSNFFQGSIFTLILLLILVAMSVLGIAYSSRYFASREDMWVSIGYLLPFFWFHLHSVTLIDIHDEIKAIAYIIIAFVYFSAWYFLRPRIQSGYQHVAAYVGGMIALVFAIDMLLGNYDLYAHLLISYIGFIFAGIYAIDTPKNERIVASFLFSFFGGILSLSSIYSDNSIVVYPTLISVIALIPAISLSGIVRLSGNTLVSIKRFVDVYSMIAAVIAGIIVLIQVLENIDFSFALFVFPGFLMTLIAYFQGTKNSTSATLMRVGAIWLSIGFFWSFLYFLSNLAPHVSDDENFWINGGIFTNWHYIKGVFAVVAYFFALSVSRDIQRIEKVDRPSFLLVILGYTTLLLLVNFGIITFCNDIGIPFETGGPRAIGTTIWWVILSISMLMVGIHYGYMYRSEKLLGLLLLLLTIGKIAFYDLASMSMDKKIIVLMVVGGIIMMFSYFLQVKGYLREREQK